MTTVAHVLTVAALIGTSAAAPPATRPAIAHANYRFGYNTPVADNGPGTGTMSVDITGPAADGGVMVSATDTWWNAVRPRATNTCEVYPNGNVACTQRPYDLSPMQLVLYPMLGRAYFNGLGPAGIGSWTQSFRVSRGDIYEWNCSFTMHGGGAVQGSDSVFSIDVDGTAAQIGGAYRGGAFQQRIAYDAAVGLPAIVQDVHAHLPQTTVFNRDFVELQLIGAKPVQ
jgi:hypothetical protein